MLLPKKAKIEPPNHAVAADAKNRAAEARCYALNQQTKYKLRGG